MLTKIVLNNIATYKTETIIDNLKAVNFFYGANGTGKSTIASYLNNPNDTLYSNCRYEPTPISDKTYVFNKKFVFDNFENTNSIKPIYRLGKENIEINNEINRLENIKKDRENLQETAGTNLTTKRNEQETKETEFTNFCWEQSKTVKKDFPEAFTGYKQDNKKSEFRNYLENNHLSKNAQTHDLNSLEQRYKTLHTDELSELPVITYQSTNFPDASILQENIVGKQDVDISALIKKFDNQDWVKQGKENLKSDDTQCPFCYQTIDDAFKQQLNDYFDESYNQQIQQLNAFKSQYADFCEAYLSNINKIKENKFLNAAEKSNLNTIKNILKNNKSVIDQKIQEPNRKFSIKSSNVFENIDKNEINFNTYLKNIIDAINLKTKEYNKLVKNRVNEKTKLKNDIWQYLADTFLRSQYNFYSKDIKTIKKEIADTASKIDTTKIEITNIRNELDKNTRKITNITQTVDEINNSLKSLGFTDFSLCVTGDKEDQYEIKRNSNQNADTEKKENVYDTLSEGEKTLIAFLYFCHLLKGSFNDTANLEPKIIVFDDPISSLDSNNLFYVSTLIKWIIREIDDENPKKEINDKKPKKEFNAKQIFILTHNMYFFKEVTYDRSKKHTNNNLKNKTHYYIISKCNNLSKIEPYPEQPIKSSYDFLCEGIKNDAKYDCRNDMRRILEIYIKFIGYENLHKLEDKFPDSEKKAYKSLTAFLHDGSHNSDMEDFEVSALSKVENYKNIFKKVFEYTENIAHYNKMMGIEEDIKKEAEIGVSKIFEQQNPTVS